MQSLHLLPQVIQPFAHGFGAGAQLLFAKSCGFNCSFPGQLRLRLHLLVERLEGIIHHGELLPARCVHSVIRICLCECGMQCRQLLPQIIQPFAHGFGACTQLFLVETHGLGRSVLGQLRNLLLESLEAVIHQGSLNITLLN